MKPPAKAIFGTVFFLSLSVLNLACQIVPLQVRKANADVSPGSVRGAVIERVAARSEAEKAGLATGDILLKWSAASGRGVIDSPFDLLVIEGERMPSGVVTIAGIRGQESRSWLLHPGDWGVTARPNFSGGLLSEYIESRDLERAGRLNEAACHLREMCSRVRGGPQWICSWLLFQSAQLLANEERWEEADRTYDDAIKASEGLPAASTGQLRLAWADIFQLRGDWQSADKYYRQQLAAAFKAHDKLLAHLTLNKLGETARSHGSFWQARSYFLRALSIGSKFAPRSIYVARTLNGLGDVAGSLEDFVKARQYFRLALTIEERLAPEGVEMAESLIGLGAAAFIRGDLANAEAKYSRALTLLERQDASQPSKARVMIGMAGIAWMRGDLPTAENVYTEALHCLERLRGERLRAAASLNGLGNIAWVRGDMAMAEDFYRRAFEIYKELAPRGLLFAESLNNLALVAADRGDLVSAENSYLEALAIEQQRPSGSYSVAFTLDDLGAIALERRDLTRAQNYHLRAFAIRQKTSPGSLDIARSLSNLGDVAFNRGQILKAWRYYRRSVAIEDRLAPESVTLALRLRRLAELERSRGDPAAAQRSIQRALRIQEKLAPEGLDTAESLNFLGDLLREHGDLAWAEHYYRRALAIREKTVAGTSVHAESLAALAAIMRSRNQLDAAAEFFDRAVSVLETQTDRLGGGDLLRSGFRANHASYYEDYIEVLLEKKQLELAFQVMERARARALLETLAADSIDIHQDADPRLLERQRNLRRALEARSSRRIRLLGRPHTPSQVEASEQEIEELLARYQQTEDEIRRSNSNYATLTHPQFLSAREVQERLLDDDSLLLEYLLGRKRSYVWALTRSSITVYELPRRAEIEKVAQRVYDLLTARTPRLREKSNLGREKYWADVEPAYARQSETLSRIVLGPVAGQIAKKKRLLLVADGFLQYLPFAAVPAPQAAGPGGDTVPMIAEHEIVNLPSASVLEVLRREQAERLPAPKSVLVLADPVFSERDPRVQQGSQSHQHASGHLTGVSLADRVPLPSMPRGDTLDLPRLLFARQEAREIERITLPGKGKIILDFDASREAAMGPELAQYRIIHFATHGIFDGEHPELSGLMLSLVDRQGRPRNGFLTLQEIYNLKLPVELVVLSGCKTALGKQIKGDGLMGLTRAFMYAGASRVVASLWNVDDAATAELMKYFYKAMEQQRMRPAAALRKAQLQMGRQKRFRDPYYWASFTVQGDWR